MLDPTLPFVMLSAGATSRLYQRPVAVIEAHAIDEVLPALDRVGKASKRGLHAAGFLSYEAGCAMESRLRALPAVSLPALPLLWFGVFEDVTMVAPDELAAFLPNEAGAAAAAPEPQMSPDAYRNAVSETLQLIAAGEVYQANISFRARVRFAGHPLALYAGLARRAQAGWGGALFTGKHWLLSASPELFFTLTQDQLTTRPMKGTATRGATREADVAVAKALAADPKNQAENLMIIDLIRNDLSRVSVPGSVRVPRLFEVETYPTIHQMTSTVEAALTPGLGAIDVLKAMFPSGSITGAPKISAMQAIAALETSARGGYTGSMGWIAPDGDAAFNVAIRTLSVRDGEQEAVLGLGAGIVADSRPADEWRECLAKGAFVTADARRFDLIETMRFENADGIADLDGHLERLALSAKTLGFAFDRHDIRNALQAATFRLDAARMVRLRLSRGGGLAIEARALPEVPREAVAVAIAALPVAQHDFRLRHKTSDRDFYDAARLAGGRFEILFVDPDGFVTEGSFTSVFVEDGASMRTPPLGRGLLPGILRARLVADGRAHEADVRVEDLRQGFWIGNAVRGLIPARLA